MQDIHSSREFSERVEIDFQKKPNRFRRRVWWSALLLSVLCLAWLGYEGAQGENHIFEAGSVATPHRIFENDCAKCHTTWAPVERVLNLDFSSTVYSVENRACLSCHPGTEHHQNQIPAHRDISCAHCHIEHDGDHDLKRVVDRICVDCHGDLESHAEDATSFDLTVDDFSRSNGHPEFAVYRLKQSDSPDPAGIGRDHKVLQLLEYVESEGWRDRTRLKFNHAAHLRFDSGPDGRPVFRIEARERDEREFTNVDQLCRACHQTDSSGAYMKPISFEQHCQSCHPLLFDNRRFPKKQVPHGDVEIVRGFLTEWYTLEALKNPRNAEARAASRPIPGRRSRPQLNQEQAEWLASQVSNAEAQTRRHEHVLFGSEAKGGCVYCHIVGDEESNGLPRIIPPGIPDRWEPHARFNHSAHQMLNCGECHGGAAKSKDTGDVLLPSVNLCRQCHSSDPAQPNGSSPARLRGARADCVECHMYHDHEKDDFIGVMNPLVGRSSANRNATPSSESTN